MSRTYKTGVMVVLFWVFVFLDAYFLPENLENYYQNIGLYDLYMLVFFLQTVVWGIGIWMSIKGLRQKNIKPYWNKLVYLLFTVPLLPFLLASFIAAIILEKIGVGSFLPQIL